MQVESNVRIKGVNSQRDLDTRTRMHKLRDRGVEGRIVNPELESRSETFQDT